ncbi:MAG: DNA helicase RecQ [Planctomyces sp.]|nr:DNA helicase RecQ [Planctomyces sp.]
MDGETDDDPSVRPLTEAEQRIASELKTGLQKYWGYQSFRPLQREAMTLVMTDHDSLVVLPTGGGKSLCYQVPAVSRNGLAIVVSPLISLMKDQVDSLESAGVAAACINSMQTGREKADVASKIRNGELKLLYIAPERLVQERTLEFLQMTKVSFVAIDEAHCISQWGHDFRPEYRKLSCLRDVFPGISIHGYTATATEVVRSDIAEQLKLKSPEILVGSFDRPNLQYRVEQRTDAVLQIQEILQRHQGESGVIYCISRKGVETTSLSLNALGFKTLPYHAGMEDEDRRRNQDAFIEEKVQIIVATVAFGMGIDKSNVRFVIHAGMPRSLENYQQESGRAGRDGLEAECTLLYSGGDVETWEYLMRDIADPEVLQASRASLKSMQRYCISLTCRHQQLVRHFGQSLESQNCGACDVCLEEMQPVDEPLIVGQKVLSSIVRQGQRFGAAYTAHVLKGRKNKRIIEYKHDQLSTYGLLKDESEHQIRNWIDQLVSLGCIRQVGEFNCLEVTDKGWQILRGEYKPQLLMIRQTAKKQTREDHWEGVNRELFEELRILRLRLAGQKNVPPYIIFSDATLRDLARQRPTSFDRLRAVYGVGTQKVSEYGDTLVKAIAEWCAKNHVPTDVKSEELVAVNKTTRSSSISLAQSSLYFDQFEKKRTIDEVAVQLDRSRGTVGQYLQEYIRLHKMTDIEHWVPTPLRKRIEVALDSVGTERLKPVFEALEGQIPYEEIRLVIVAREVASQ